MKKPANYTAVTPSFTPLNEGVYMLAKPYEQGEGIYTKAKGKRKQFQKARKKYYEQLAKDKAQRFDAISAYGPIKGGSKRMKFSNGPVK